MATRDPTTAWLLEGDPAIRWQVMRDLLGCGAHTWKAEWRRVASEGWGAELLARQNEDGNWGRGPYQPKWTSTTYTLQLLRRMGLPPRHPAALKACTVLVKRGQFDDGGINFWSRRLETSETCVTGMVLSQLCHFRHLGDAAERLLGFLLREQMPDGGWNCERYRGAKHASFHTTISVLEGLREYINAGRPSSGEALAAERWGREFLLEHRICRSSTTGKVVRPELTRFHFPPRWHHDVLRGLDHFQAAGADRDDRLEDAIALVEKRRGRDGLWALPRGYPGAVFLELERVGRPSRWNTLRATRVLAWWRDRPPRDQPPPGR